MELHSQRRFSTAAAFWGCATAALLAAAAIVGNLHLVFLALAPALLALGLIFGREKPFHGVLTDEALVTKNPSYKILYSEIEGLTIGGFGADPDQPSLRPGPIVITQHYDVLEIPAALNVPTQQVYQAILAKIPTTGAYRLSPSLMKLIQDETARFGAERVHAFARRNIVGQCPSNYRWQVCAGMLLLCGILWCIGGFCSHAMPQKNAMDYAIWFGYGFWLVIFSGITVGCLSRMQKAVPVDSRMEFVAMVANGRASSLEHSVAKMLHGERNAELVVSPSGLAIQTGDTLSYLTWAAIRDIRLCRRIQGSEIRIVLPRETIRLPDLYVRPIALIYRQMQRLWKEK